LKPSRPAKILELIKFDKKIAKSNPVIGVDEAGRGPIAGPVTACALYFPKITRELKETLKYLDDSKRFSSNPKLREELAEEIKKHAIYSIAEASVREIEKINILQASLLAMRRSMMGLSVSLS
jgi:ribonuclease HII